MYAKVRRDENDDLSGATVLKESLKIGAVGVAAGAVTVCTFGAGAAVVAGGALTGPAATMVLASSGAELAAAAGGAISAGFGAATTVKGALAEAYK